VNLVAPQAWILATTKAKSRNFLENERNLRRRGGHNGAGLPAAATGRWNAPSTSREVGSARL
jgi:hypothetical protein